MLLVVDSPSAGELQGPASMLLLVVIDSHPAGECCAEAQVPTWNNGTITTGAHRSPITMNSVYPHRTIILNGT